MVIENTGRYMVGWCG